MANLKLLVVGGLAVAGLAYAVTRLAKVSASQQAIIQVEDIIASIASPLHAEGLTAEQLVQVEQVVAQIAAQTPIIAQVITPETVQQAIIQAVSQPPPSAPLDTTLGIDYAWIQGLRDDYLLKNWWQTPTQTPQWALIEARYPDYTRQQLAYWAFLGYTSTPPGYQSNTDIAVQAGDILRAQLAAAGVV